jgi:hypothetical protein
VIDETYYMSGLAALTMDNFTANYGFTAADKAALKSLAAGAVYRLDGLVSEAEGLDWFETAVARPDLVSGPPAACCLLGGEHSAPAPSRWPATCSAGAPLAGSFWQHPRHGRPNQAAAQGAASSST